MMTNKSVTYNVDDRNLVFMQGVFSSSTFSDTFSSFFMLMFVHFISKLRLPGSENDNHSDCQNFGNTGTDFGNANVTIQQRSSNDTGNIPHALALEQ